MNWCGVISLLAWGILLTIPPTNSCSCIQRHPQQHACQSDFVLMAKLRRVSKQSADSALGMVAYKIRVKKFFKTNDKVNVSLQKGKLYTGPSSCQINFEKRTLYVLVGNLVDGKPVVRYCNFAEPWRSLSSKTRKGFRLLYHSACTCEIQSCHWWQNSCPTSTNSCSWETVKQSGGEDCQLKHGICSKLSDGTCDWLGGRAYRRCMKEYNNVYGTPSTTVGHVEQISLPPERQNNVIRPQSRLPLKKYHYSKKYNLKSKHSGYRNKIGYLSNYVQRRPSSYSWHSRAT